MKKGITEKAISVEKNIAPYTTVHYEIFFDKEVSSEAVSLWSFVLVASKYGKATKKMIRDRYGWSYAKMNKVWEELVAFGYAEPGFVGIFERRRRERRVMPRIVGYGCCTPPSRNSGKVLEGNNLGRKNNNKSVTPKVGCQSFTSSASVYHIIEGIYYDLKEKRKNTKEKRKPIPNLQKYAKALEKANKQELKNIINLSMTFLNKQQKHWPNYVKEVSPDKVLSGAVTIHKLIRIDHYEYSEIKMVLKWLAENPTNFWSRQVLSLRSLRKICSDDITKFDHLRIARDRSLDRTNVNKKGKTEEPINKHTERKAKELNTVLYSLTGIAEDTTYIANKVYLYFKELPKEAQKRFDPEGAYLGFMSRYIDFIKARYGDWDGLSVNMLAPPDSLCWSRFLNKMQQRYRINFKTGSDA